MAQEADRASIAGTTADRSNKYSWLPGLLLVLSSCLLVSVSVALSLSSARQNNSSTVSFSVLANSTERHQGASSAAAAARTEVVVAWSGKFWWAAQTGSHDWSVPGCTWRGQPLGCQYVSVRDAVGNSTGAAMLPRAQAVIQHMCWNHSETPEHVRHLPQVMFGHESVARYPCMNRQRADMEMSYRKCSQVSVHTVLELLSRSCKLQHSSLLPAWRGHHTGLVYNHGRSSSSTDLPAW